MVLTLSLSFLILLDLQSISQVFCRLYFNLGFSDVLSCFQMRHNSCSIKCNLVKRTITWLFIYTELCNRHHDLIPKPSHHARRKPRAPISLFVHCAALSLVPSLLPQLQFSPGRWSCFLSVSLCVSTSELLCLSLSHSFLFLCFSTSVSPCPSLHPTLSLYFLPSRSVLLYVACASCSLFHSKGDTSKTQEE